MQIFLEFCVVILSINQPKSKVDRAVRIGKLDFLISVNDVIDFKDCFE